jgi:hypothetical protein
MYFTEFHLESNLPNKTTIYRFRGNDEKLFLETTRQIECQGMHVKNTERPH